MARVISGHAALRDAARRIAVLFGALVGITVLISALLGLASGGSIERAVAVGFYVVGAVLLTGCFVFGIRGPLRGVSKSGDAASTLGGRRVRKATGGERADAARMSILLFCLGLSMVVLGALVDPAHTVL